MAKTESTAVNALIGDVNNSKRAPTNDPGSDLFAPAREGSGPLFVNEPPDLFAAMKEPFAEPRSTSTPRRTVQPPRGSPIAPMRGSSEVVPLPRGRAPLATGQHVRPGLPPPAPRATSASPCGTRPPANAPIAAPFVVRVAGASEPALPQEYPIVAPIAAVSASLMAPAPSAHAPAERGLAVAGHTTSWLASDETRVGTMSARSPRRALARKLALPMVGAIAIGIGLGAYLATRGKRAPSVAEHTVEPVTTLTMTATTTATPAAPVQSEQVAAVASVTANGTGAAIAPDAPQTNVPSPGPEAQPARGAIAFVDVRIDSQPAGATVTLVDRGKQVFLGTTPLATSLDSSRAYDVIIALDGRPTQMAHLDPSKSTRLDVSLGGRVARATTPAVPSRESARAEVAARAPQTAAAPRGVPAPSTAPEAAKLSSARLADPFAEPAAPQAATETGVGTLMISSKPPCEIYIDGKPTGLSTPQRSIELAAGTHKITLVNEEAGIKKSLPVRIKADEATKLIQDLTGG
jgi:hypothetical protein